MKNTFRWNPYADQPHNVAPKSERLKHHLRHSPSYLLLLGSNLKKMMPGMKRYFELRNGLYKDPVEIFDPFGLCFTPSQEKNEIILGCFRELGIRNGLFRIPSWEMENFKLFEDTLDLFSSHGIGICLALLQQREDVLDPQKWNGFLEEAFSRFGRKGVRFEIGHAWNRTKWGIWDHREYLQLAEAAVGMSEGKNIDLVGPAVIDFEFHLYPSILRSIPFEIISSLLYADRMGAPENTQFGWDLPKKIALLRAAVDTCADPSKELWITEFNWPLKGTGRYSPVSGKPNVTEDQQANYLARYFILSLTTGYVQRVYWWQLAAPGYGLIDNREGNWRRRPAFHSLRMLVSSLGDSIFVERMEHPEAYIFLFTKGKERFAVGWTNGKSSTVSIDEPVKYIKSGDGGVLSPPSQQILLDESPKYIGFHTE